MVKRINAVDAGSAFVKRKEMPGSTGWGKIHHGILYQKTQTGGLIRKTGI